MSLKGFGVGGGFRLENEGRAHSSHGISDLRMISWVFPCSAGISAVWGPETPIHHWPFLHSKNTIFEGKVSKFDTTNTIKLVKIAKRTNGSIFTHILPDPGRPGVGQKLYARRLLLSYPGVRLQFGCV